MFLINAKYLDRDFCLVRGDLELENGKIKQVGKKLSYTARDMAVDCEGYTVIPGFVDVHIHGCGGADNRDGAPGAPTTLAPVLF